MWWLCVHTTSSNCLFLQSKHFVNAYVVHKPWLNLLVPEFVTPAKPQLFGLKLVVHRVTHVALLDKQIAGRSCSSPICIHPFTGIRTSDQSRKTRE